MSRILLVEDNNRIAELIGTALRRVGIEVDEFGDMESAQQAIKTCDYTMLILDRELPDGDGLQLIRKLRASQKQIPCLMLTARDAVHDRIEGLESGADDYLSKPFSIDELVARVRALMRRPHALQELTPRFGDIEFDRNGTSLLCGSCMASLPPAEIQIMKTLMKEGGRTIRRNALEQAAWGLGEAVTLNALDVAIHRLRKKLHTIGSSVSIVNVRGIGYALREDGDTDEET